MSWASWNIQSRYNPKFNGESENNGWTAARPPTLVDKFMSGVTGLATSAKNYWTNSDPQKIYMLPTKDNPNPETPSDSRPASSGVSSAAPDWIDSNGNTWNTYDYLGNGSIGGSSAKSWDYLNADLARQYGMSRETAYQEALSNTGYQRSVSDMQAAGLNPSAIFGAGSGYQASGVGYVSAASPSSGGSGYVAQTGVSRHGSSAKAQTDYNLTGKQYALIQLLGAGLGALTTKSFAGALSGAALGRYVAQYLGNK